MDYSHLHTYAPPQCLPENTGYTYSLSSSYSSAALEFESLNKLDPVFDSPRMSRRSLRLSHTVNNTDDLHNDSVSSNTSYFGNMSSMDRSSNRSTRQVLNSSKQSASSSHHSTQMKSLSNSSFLSHSSAGTYGGDMSVMSSILDESLIREQTEVDHLWGLDEDDPKAGDTTVIEANGELNAAQTQTTMINGYTCSDCSMISDRSNVLTACSASPTTSANQHTSSIVYSRNRIQKQSTHSNYCGSLNVQNYLKEDGHLRINGESLWYFLQQIVQSVAAAGWFVSRKALSFLWLAIVSPGYYFNFAHWHAYPTFFEPAPVVCVYQIAYYPQGLKTGKAASGIFWWLGTGWYQLATLISLLNVFLLTRCLPKMNKLLLLLLPLLLLLGLWFWGIGNLWSLLPAFSGLRTQTGKTAEDSVGTFKSTPDIGVPMSSTQETDFHIANKIKELEKQLALLAANHSHHIKDHSTLVLLVQNIQEQVVKYGDQSQMSTLITTILNEQLATLEVEKSEKSTDSPPIDTEYKGRILHLEMLLGKLSEAIEEDRKRRHSSGGGEDQEVLRRRIQSLEQEFAAYKAEFLKEKAATASCEQADCVLQKVDARVRESLQMMFASQENLPESFKQWLSATYLSKADFNGILQELEMRILKKITHHASVTKQVPSAAVVEQAVTAGISGITEQEARVIVNNALKLYSQDRTGMVDFALESGGGSILGTRCSETYETKTALLSLFGIPLWYFSQSPRVVIQPDMYPGNCWAFKGAQGYLVVRLSMMIYPTFFSLEHIPKSLSPTGNITSAPKDFAVYGLDDEYQEDGTLLVQSTYDQDGEPLQIFQSTEENTKPFQIVELRIYSNWGHTDYTCIYRFRAHGTPAK